jgi:tetratricopeptide (TPR) repeat protein
VAGVAREAAVGPVGEFCAALRRLRADSGADIAVLARQLGVSRTQLYAVLAGEVRRPPDWDRVVRPLVEACTGGDQAALAWWRRRHAVLVEVAEEMRRRDRAARRAGPGGVPAEAVAARPAEIRFSLPPDTAAFTGRDAELTQIAAAAAAGGVIAVRGIGGMGKTALAVHAARLLAGRFPDRQLFIDLHAHTPGRDPLVPEAALAGLLAAAGVDPGRMPGDLAGRSALWRDKLAGQRAVLVLDNAASSAQVAPLLPGAAGCLVLVTSRRHLGDLPGPALPLLLDALSPGQAQEMFARLAPRATAGPEAAELAELAGCLPLAVSLLARVHGRHPSWTLADVITETRSRLLTLTAENQSVAAAFGVSYRYLAPDRQELFRRLGLHPGTTTDACAAAALAGVSLPEAASLLDALQGEGLLTETGYRRYGMHDLIRRYARDLAASDPAAGRDQALGRLLDYYQDTAGVAEALLALQPRARPPGSRRTPPGAAPGLADRARALTWARAERENLLACLDHATRAGLAARVVALTAGLTTLLRHDGPWSDAISRHATAAQAAQRTGDKQARAGALTSLAVTQRLTGDLPAAARTLETALGIHRAIADRPGQARALSELGIIRWQAGDLPGAASALEEALGIYPAIGDRPGQASALSELGVARQLAGDYPAAASALEAALGISRDLGDPLREAHALNHLAAVRLRTGDSPGAARAAQAALDICRATGDRLGQADALAGLGAARQLTGDYQGAAEALEAALGIHRHLGDRLGQASALTRIGTLRRRTGGYPAAAGALEEALGITRDIGNQAGQADALNELGILCRARGDLPRARARHQQALDLARRIGSPWNEAGALAGLGRCALAEGRTADALAGLRQAQEIFRRTGAADAADVAAELIALAQAGPDA